jgi:hypothetical protein
MALYTYWYSAKFNDELNDLHGNSYVNGKAYNFVADDYEPHEYSAKRYDDWEIVHTDTEDIITNTTYVSNKELGVSEKVLVLNDEQMKIFHRNVKFDKLEDYIWKNNISSMDLDDKCKEMISELVNKSVDEIPSQFGSLEKILNFIRLKEHLNY